MEMPPPLPSPAKSGLGAGKIVLIVFATIGVLALLAVVGLYILGSLADANGSPSSRTASPAPTFRLTGGFTPADIEARCRASGLDYHALGRDSRLLDRASEEHQEQLAAKGIKVYRAKIRKKYDVVFIISIIEAPRDFTSSQAKEILGMLAPSTPVAVHGRFIYCNAGRPDPRGRGDEVIWMTPKELYEAL
jgi:hypothetical protein